MPRRKSVVIAKSLPIKVRAEFDPSFRIFDDRFDENKGNPSYKQKVSRKSCLIRLYSATIARLIIG